MSSLGVVSRQAEDEERPAATLNEAQKGSVALRSAEERHRFVWVRRMLTLNRMRAVEKQAVLLSV